MKKIGNLFISFQLDGRLITIRQNRGAKIGVIYNGRTMGEKDLCFSDVVFTDKIEQKLNKEVD